ncbi:MAG: ATP-binding cassette domain-containing protein [Gemmatimonadota bacterium]|nr:ATP-binding cassette domain-containing protein [Gemmatimonadota bacterium]
MTAAARLRGVTRRFGAVTALGEVDFELAPGEIHGLLGENGAGKTTLARILAGLLAPDAGGVEIGGRSVALRSAREARALGVAMVHQHFSLVPRFTGLENIALFNAGAWTGRGTEAPDYRALVRARARELKLEVELDAPVAGLGVGERQRIEVLKALMSETGVLLLDEPTAVLAPREVEGLFAVLRRVAEAGTGIVLVAHKLDEVLAVADRVTVLRRGRRVLTEEAGKVTAAGLAEAMVGEPVGRPGREHPPGRGPRGLEPEPVATLEGVTVRSGGTPLLRDVDLAVRPGEILGIAGVDGNGQRTLAAVLAGIRTPDKGTATLPREVGWIPQDRGEEGLVNDFTIIENVAFALHGKAAYRRGPWFDWAGVEETAGSLMREMDVRAESPETTAGTLSGGNQQRVVAGREFLRSAEMLVAESPTRGLDVKATVAVRARIAGLATTPSAGAREHQTTRRPPAAPKRPPGIVLISADLDEILELSHRIAVMVRGRLIPVPRDRHTRTAIGELMLGAQQGGGPR